MAINLHCSNCKSSSSIKSKYCKKCGRGFINGKKKYRVVVNSNGKRISKVVTSFKKAKKLENKLISEAIDFKLFGIVQAPLVDEIWKKYLSWAKEIKKSWKQDQSRWNGHIKKHLTGRPMDSVRTYDVQQIITEMKHKKDYAPATIKHVIVLVKRIYNWSMEMDLYKGQNPAANIKLPKFDNEVTECLTRSEIQRLFKTLDSWINQRMSLLVKFALFTGFRRGEIFSLKWKDVDFENGLVKLKDPKGIKTETLPVSDQALIILKQAKGLLPTENCLYVFPNRHGKKRTSFGNTWTKIKKHAKIDHKFRFHDLRHTFASYLASSGKVTLYTLQKLLTHKSPQMTQRYAHLFDETLRESANVLTDMI